ncbi:MAG TPA: DmsC/YnfH family molybdoenzyme membrane anchor subunit [Acidimicrobiales bacterium]|nr:DmsC/YnfH family molybdoenzyme membrane anchor subunit [Acidimicrobiales bacterium]
MSLLSAVPAIGETEEVVVTPSAGGALTAVEQFAEYHDHVLAPGGRRYRDLIPTERPGPGHQYAFEVDLDACTGCKACVAACHSLNGLEDGETWRSVSLLHRGTAAEPVLQTVTASCHHCLDPACLRGCPVDAYEKDPLTGIVRHLDDQCIGCRYCTLSCPYEVPAYEPRRGIVRKCDMCHGRLEAGEAPACVQGCPNEAISIAVVDVAASRAAAESGMSVPGAAPSFITGPTTVYVGSRREALTRGAPSPEPTGPAHDHPPLAVMLVLTQLAVGAFVIGLIRAVIGGGSGPAPAVDAGLAVASGALALAASVFHLGRPRYAHRAVIGLRHSWLSREIVAFGGFTGLAVLYAAVVASRLRLPAGWTETLGWLAASSGATAVACSVMIYATTRRASWRVGTVASRFGLSGVVCGSAALAWAAVVTTGPGSARPLLVLVAAAAALKLAGEATVFLPGRPADHADRVRRARLLKQDLRPRVVTRFGLGALSGVVLPLAAVWLSAGAHPAALPAALLASGALGGCVAAEYAERSLFFTTASAPR